jgi:CBS domain-containing protein
MAVTVASMLSKKGTDVLTVAPDAPISSAVEVMATNNVGALVVSADGSHVDGILSERDVVRHLHEHGEDVMERSVRSVMTSEVRVCRNEDTSDQLMARMTASRIRHLPVIVDDGLAGIISIGDVVKYRLEELETAASSLREYITGSSY